ncbi:MAG: GGDEF domain-containing protein, partial [Rhizobiales bacterium]|nr:GGDEF domain-containing protein [Hyphomicrobiales bacterium]
MALGLNELRDRISVRHQVAVLAGLLCVATAVVVAIVAGTIAREEAVHAKAEALVAVAGEMATRLDQQMFERYREIRNTAGLRPLRPIWSGDPDGVRDVLEQIQGTLPEYAWIGFAAPDGVVLAATGGLLEGVSVAERPWFIGGLRGPTVEDVHDAKLLAKLLSPSPDDEPFRFVDVAVPVTGVDGRMAGVLGAHLSWRWAEEVKTEVLETRREDEDIEI